MRGQTGRSSRGAPLRDAASTPSLRRETHRGSSRPPGRVPCVLQSPRCAPPAICRAHPSGGSQTCVPPRADIRLRSPEVRGPCCPAAVTRRDRTAPASLPQRMGSGSAATMVGCVLLGRGESRRWRWAVLASQRNLAVQLARPRPSPGPSWSPPPRGDRLRRSDDLERAAAAAVGARAHFPRIARPRRRSARCPSDHESEAAVGSSLNAFRGCLTPEAAATASVPHRRPRPAMPMRRRGRPHCPVAVGCVPQRGCREAQRDYSRLLACSVGAVSPSLSRFRPRRSQARYVSCQRPRHWLGAVCRDREVAM